MIVIDLRADLDSRASLEAFAVASALATLGRLTAVATPGGRAPHRFMSSVPVVAHGTAAETLIPWPVPGAAPPVPINERAYWRGESKFEDIVAFASELATETYAHCHRTARGAEFIGADAAHELDALDHLRQASVAVFATPRPECLVGPAEAMAAGCAVLACKGWRLPEGAVAGEHLWVVPLGEIPGALARLLDDSSRGARRALRDAGAALAACHREAILGPRWGAWFEGRLAAST